MNFEICEIVAVTWSTVVSVSAYVIKITIFYVIIRPKWSADAINKHVIRTSDQPRNRPTKIRQTINLNSPEDQTMWLTYLITFRGQYVITSQPTMVSVLFYFIQQISLIQA